MEGMPAHKKTASDIPPLPDVFDDDGRSTPTPIVGSRRMVVEVEEDETLPTESNVRAVDIDMEEKETVAPEKGEDEQFVADLPSPSIPAPSMSDSEMSDLPKPFSRPEAISRIVPPPSIPRPIEPPVADVSPVEDPVEPEPELVAVDEPSLPDFFTNPEPQDDAPLKINGLPIQDMTQTEQTPEEKMLEETVPQAYISETREIAKEVRSEKRNMLVTISIVVGAILVVVGLGGLALSTIISKPSPTVSTAATPKATTQPVASTTPVASASATPTASTTSKPLKVNVYNGTTIKGLAAKEAAILKDAKMTLGTVGNGDPKLAGTIIVPTGKKEVGTQIEGLLTGFTFKITESATATEISVTLGEPTP